MECSLRCRDFLSQADEPLALKLHEQLSGKPSVFAYSKSKNNSLEQMALNHSVKPSIRNPDWLSFSIGTAGEKQSGRP